MPDTPRADRPSGSQLLLSVLLGLGVGLLGTVLHLRLTALGSVVLPWGAAVALLMLAAAQLWWSRAAAHRLAGPVLGAAAFTTAWALQLLPRDDALGVPWTDVTALIAPGALAGSVLWLVGSVPVVVAVALWRLAETRREDRRGTPVVASAETTAQTPGERRHPAPRPGTADASE